MPLNEQLEPLGHGRVARLALGQRADAGRIVDHEDRPDQRVFDLLLEDFALDHVGVLAGRLEADLFGQALTPAASSRVNAGVLCEQLVVGLAGKRRREVDRRVAPGQLATAVRSRRSRRR